MFSFSDKMHVLGSGGYVLSWGGPLAGRLLEAAAPLLGRRAGVLLFAFALFVCLPPLKRLLYLPVRLARCACFSPVLVFVVI